MNIRDEVMAALQEVFTPKKNKKVKTPKFVVVVDGRVLTTRVPNKKELIKTVKAIVLRSPESKIEVYKYNGTINVELPVSGDALIDDEEVENG